MISGPALRAMRGVAPEIKRGCEAARAAIVAARRPLAFYVLGRLITLGTVLALTVLNPGLRLGKLLSAWDGGWYLKLLAEGYPHHVPEVGGQAVPSVIGFFPLYPMIVRIVARTFFLPDLAAAIVVSIAFGAAAVVLVQRLVALFTDAQTAERAAIFFALFPGSFIFALPYTEAVMLTLAAGCLIALLRGRWVTAGLCAAVATACRPNALALAAACAWQALVVIRHRREWNALVAPLIAPAGVVAYFLFLKLRVGEFTAWVRVEKEGWGQGPTMGWRTVRPLVRFVQNPLSGVNEFTLGAGLLFTLIGLGLLLWRRWPGAITVYVLAVAFMGANARLDSLRPRGLLTAFPLILAIGAAIKGERFNWLLAASVPTLILLTVCYTTLRIGQI